MMVSGHVRGGDSVRAAAPPRRAACGELSPVPGVVCAGVVRPHHHKDVLEVRADVLWGERLRAGLLEDDGDDVVPDVSLP